MSASAPILYCHCAYADALPAGVNRAVLDGLAESGAAFEAVADLCEQVARRDPGLQRVAARPGVQIIACHPRAVRWLFAFAGAPLPEDAVIHDMRARKAEDILAAVLGPDRRRGGGAQPVPTFPPKRPGEWTPWFPVIDYDRCIGCKQCAEFCLFGTYAVDAQGAVRVVQPAKCKTHCPACARVCPASAIIFPKFTEGGPISGDEGVLAESADQGMKADLERLGQTDVYDALRLRAARARAAAQARYGKEPGDR